jgi:hypothetical protein
MLNNKSGVKLSFTEAQEDSGKGWVLVFPRGKHFINKYDFILDCNDNFFSGIKDWWENSTFKKPYIDKAHEFGEKYGEFTDLRITGKGLEMFMVLNEAGKELIKSGKYEYLSPTFNNAADSTGKQFQNVIFSVSLVNSPALMVLDKIQNQIKLSMQGDDENYKTKKGGSLMDLRELVAGKLKLSAGADDLSILTRIETLLNAEITIGELKDEITGMKKSLEDSTTKLSVVEKEKGELAEKHKKASEALDKMQLDAIDAESKSVIDEAIKLGQFHPALRDMKIEQYKKDKDSVVKELSVLPKKEGDKKMTIAGAGDKSFDCSEEDKAILLDAGYDLTKDEDLALAKQFLDDMKKREA